MLSLSPEMNYLVHQEQHKDRLRDIEHQHLLQAIDAQSANLASYQQTVHWLGDQMVKLGSKLQDYGASPPTNTATVETR